jgi:hypothetical protein
VKILFCRCLGWGHGSLPGGFVLGWTLYRDAAAAEWGALLFVVTLSLGESIWSPRWYDYSMSLAPHGREGIFTALASAPLFAAKLPTGAPAHTTLPNWPATAPSKPKLGNLSGCSLMSAAAAVSYCNPWLPLYKGVYFLWHGLGRSIFDAAAKHMRSHVWLRPWPHTLEVAGADERGAGAQVC